MKNFKSNLKQTVRAFPLLVVMLLCSSALLAVPGWSNTNMSARQSTADELSDRQPSSAWQPSYQGYQSQLFEIGTTNVPSDYSEISSESSGSHKVGPRKLGGGTDVGEQSENSPIGEPWIMVLFALLACGVIAYRKMNIKHHSIMKKIFTSSFHEKLKMLLIAIGLMVTSINTAWAADVQKNAIIYMDNSAASWSYSNIYFVINNTNGYPMSAVANTKLYVHKRSADTWGGYSNVRFFAATSSWGGDDASMGSESNMVSYGANLTNTQTNYGFNGDNYYVIKLDKAGTKTSSSTRANLSTSYIGNAISAMNKTITVKAKVSTDGGSSYSEATSPGTLSASSKKFTAYNSCASATSLSSGTISCGYTATTTLTAADATGYDFVGWYNSSGTRQTTSKTLTIYPTANATYYAYYKVTQYTVSYGVNSSTRWGSIQLNSETAITTTGSKALNHGTAIAFTATPNSGYQVEGWYSDAACSAGNRLQSGGTSYNAGMLTAAKTVYVKFEEKTGGIVTLNAGSNGQVSLDNSSWGATKTKTDITTNTAFNIYAKGNTGYHFTSWTKDSGSGTIGSTSTANTTFTPVAYEDASLTAAFAETKSTITVTTATTSWGSLKFGSTAKNWGTTASLGVATTQSITATAASGYKFVRWDLSDAAASSSTLTGATITLKADGSGSTGTATAVFEEDLSTPYIVTGGNKIVTSGTTWRTTADQYNKILKATGHSTESIGYFTVPVTATNTGASNSNYQFKIYKTTATTNYYGLTATGQYYLTRDQDNGISRTLYTSGANIELRADITGDYLIKVDYSTPASGK